MVITSLRRFGGCPYGTVAGDIELPSDALLGNAEPIARWNRGMPAKSDAMGSQVALGNSTVTPNG